MFATQTADGSFDYIALPQYLGLKTGDVIVPLVARGGGLLWFVVDVDGPGRTVTARTVIFGGRGEDTFRFTEIDLQSPRTADDTVDAAEARRRLGLSVSPRARQAERIVRTVAAVELDVRSLPPRYRKLLDLPTAPVSRVRERLRVHPMFDAAMAARPRGLRPSGNRMPRLRKRRTEADAIEDPHQRRNPCQHRGSEVPLPGFEASF